MPEALEVERTGVVVASHIRWATSLSARMRGLVGRPALGRGEALVLAPAKQIHTYGMTYPIDVIFCDRLWKVRHVCRMMHPARITRPVPASRYAIELCGGSVPSCVRSGDVLRTVTS